MTPERAHGWIGTLLPLAQQGGPLLTLGMLVALVLTLWYGLGVLDRAVLRNHTLVERLLTQQDAHRAELMRCYAHGSSTVPP